MYGHKSKVLTSWTSALHNSSNEAILHRNSFMKSVSFFYNELHST